MRVFVQIHLGTFHVALRIGSAVVVSSPLDQKITSDPSLCMGNSQESLIIPSITTRFIPMIVSFVNLKCLTYTDRVVGRWSEMGNTSWCERPTNYFVRMYYESGEKKKNLPRWVLDLSSRPSPGMYMLVFTCLCRFGNLVNVVRGIGLAVFWLSFVARKVRWPTRRKNPPRTTIPRRRFPYNGRNIAKTRFQCPIPCDLDAAKSFQAWN